MKIFVGNLSLDVTDEDLRQAFEPFGKVESAEVVKERFSAASRGFGFVEMPSDAEARLAISEMNGKDLKGRPLTVNQARAREERRPGGGGPRGRRY